MWGKGMNKESKHGVAMNKPLTGNKIDLSHYFNSSSVFLFCLLGLFFPALASAVTPMMAAGTLSTVALKSDADFVKTLSLLRKQAEESGTTRIIVGLRIVFTPEGELTATAVAQQRNEIARVQSMVLEKVPSLKQRPERIKRFVTIPFMALEVNDVELEALASLAEIASIEEDRLAAPTFGIGVVKPESK